jgi:hypothetical protein
MKLGRARPQYAGPLTEREMAEIVEAIEGHGNGRDDDDE